MGRARLTTSESAGFRITKEHGQAVVQASLICLQQHSSHCGKGRGLAALTLRCSSVQGQQCWSWRPRSEHRSVTNDCWHCLSLTCCKKRATSFNNFTSPLSKLCIIILEVDTRDTPIRFPRTFQYHLFQVIKCLLPNTVAINSTFAYSVTHTVCLE